MNAGAPALPGTVTDAVQADPHAAGSVDCRLLESQVLVTPATAAGLYAPPQARTMAAERQSRPELERIVQHLIADSVHPFQRATALRRWVAAIPRVYPEGGPATRDGRWGDYRAFRCGGTEEAVIARGSPLAAERSRVLVALAQIADVPARLVFCYADEAPVRHTVAEIHIAGRWSVFDPVSDRAFVWVKHGYASAWEIHRMPSLLDALPDHGRLPYVAGRFYRHLAVAEYDPWDPAHDFAETIVDPVTAARLRRGEAS